MRCLFTFLLIIFLVPVIAQEQTNSPPPNYAVQFYGVNTNGYPFYWPRTQETVGTNTQASPPWVVFTPEQYADLIATNLAAFTIAKSNRLWLVNQTVTANLAALVWSYSNLQWCADNWTSVTNLNNLKIAVKAEGDVLLKLRPVLNGLYHGE